MLSAVLSQAVEDNLLEANPALRMGKYLRRGDEPEPEVAPYARKEMQQLLNVPHDQYRRWYPLLLTAFRTGLRQGELLALRWRDRFREQIPRSQTERRSRQADDAEESSTA